MSGPAVGSLLAKQEIRDALARYCRAMDRRDEALAAELWHADGTADYGADIFQGSGAGFAAWVTEVHGGFERHSHQITNVLIELSGPGAAGNTAVSEAYVTVVLRTAPGPGGVVTQITSRGRYLDHWAWRDDRWAVMARQYVDDFTTSEQLTPVEAGTPSPVGRRDSSDPSYALFGHSG